MEEMEETYADFAGRERRFKTTLRETPGGLSAESVEMKDGPGGYRFQVVVPSGAAGSAYSELRKKMHRVLSTRHLKRDGGSWLPAHDVLRGRITSDPDAGEPLVIIDGEALDWAQFGRLLLTHEGFEFELALIG